MRDVLDSHMHTIASGHAYSTLHEMVKAAADKGLELIGITEHSMAMPGTCHEYYFMNMRVLPRSMYGIEVMHGAEVNIMDEQGTLDMEEYLLKKMDVVIASMHTPCMKKVSREANTQAAIRAMKNPYVNILGHPDDGRFPLDYRAVVQAAKEFGVLIELNNNSLHPLCTRENPIPNDIELLKYCKEYGAPVILGSDAHIQEDVGNHQFLEILLEAVDFPETLIVNRSKEEYKAYINRFKRS